MKLCALWLAILSSATLLTAPALAAAPDTNLGIQAAFPRPNLQKMQSFGLVITGATIVAAGAFTYLTAGAGAPPAAAGVSAVASWVAGGGAGSYMAGASIVGSWFGGNAMLGAAVLNGISLGTVGATGSWGTLNAGQKVLALGSTTATAMDGLALISKPETKQLEWRVILPVPTDLADDRTRKLLDALLKAGEKVAKSATDLAAKTKQAPDSPKPAELLEAERTFEAAKATYQTATNQLNDELARVLKSGASNRMTVLMAVIAQNAGRSAEFRNLLSRIKIEQIKERSYLDYLRGIAALQVGNVAQAESHLEASQKAASFIIEPAILLASITAQKGFKAQESKVNEIADSAEKHFDSNAYMTQASLVSLHYRIGTMALGANRCDRALKSFKKAQSEHSLINKYWTGKAIRNSLEIGEANALHCQGKRDDSYRVFNAVWQRTPAPADREMLCAQYSGGCSS